MRLAYFKISQELVHEALLRGLSSPLVVKALNAAHEGFKGVTRKGPSGLRTQIAPRPYVEHPVEVFLYLMVLGYDEVTLAAAILHDHLEDLKKRGWNEDKMRAEFGDEVTDLVSGLTKPDGVSWEESLDGFVEQLRRSDDRVLAIAAGDCIVNMKDSVAWYERGVGIADYLKRDSVTNHAKWKRIGALLSGRVHPLLEEDFQCFLARIADFIETVDGQHVREACG